MPEYYYVFISGKKIPVDEEVYRAIKRPEWAEKRRNRRHAEKGDHILSLDAFLEAGYEPISEDPLIEEIVEDKLFLEMLYSALLELTEDERGLVDALYYQAKSEHTVARENGVSQNTIHYRKKRVLEKLRQIMERKK